MIDKILILSAVLAVIFIVSCSQQMSDSTVKKDDSPRVYNFSITPYNSISVPDRALYNYMFNIIRNKLVYYVENTLPSNSELIGTLLELKYSGQGKKFENIINGSIIRGWNIYDTDTVPIPDVDIALLNSGNPAEGNALIPKARYFIKYSENSAVVYVRYWMLQYRNYDFVYFLEKNPSWNLIKAEEIH